MYFSQMTAQLADQEEKIAEREMRIAACDAEYERVIHTMSIIQFLNG